ncbi:MAG: transporter substrate-binding protein, partial [Pseudomonadota bacterium]
ILVWQSRWLLQPTTYNQFSTTIQKDAPIKLGVLYQLDDASGENDKPVIDTINLTVDAINQSGGLLGKQIEVVIANSGATESAHANAANRLLNEPNISAVIGCPTSACRKVVKPLFERKDHLLFYPSAHEGIEQSKNIIYSGTTPNQLIVPSVLWSIDNIGPQLFLVGSQQIYSHVVNALINDLARSTGAVVVGEYYLEDDIGNIDEIISTIRVQRPALVISTATTDEHRLLMRKIRSAGFESNKLPALSFNKSRWSLSAEDLELFAGDYIGASYFPGATDEINRAFISSYQEQFGTNRIIEDSIVSAHASVSLWALAVETSNSADPKVLRQHLPGLTFAGLDGPIAIDRYNNHVWKASSIAKIQPKGTYDVVWNSGAPVSPSPYPRSRNRETWEWLINRLYESWDNRWTGSTT